MATPSDTSASTAMAAAERARRRRDAEGDCEDGARDAALSRWERGGAEAVDEELRRGDGFEFHISERWAHCYPGEEVAVVTSIEKPPVPPEGYIPLRLGVHQQIEDTTNRDNDEDVAGFSLDTLLWSEELLESRLEELTAWTRRAPLSLKEKLDRINWLINSK